MSPGTENNLSLTLAIKPSRWLRWCHALVHLLLILLIFLAPFSWFVTVVAALVTLINYMILERKQNKQARVTALRANDGVFGLGIQGRMLTVGPPEKILINELLLIFQFAEAPSDLRQLVLFRDSLGADEWRRLRVYLRLMHG